MSEDVQVSDQPKTRQQIIEASLVSEMERLAAEGENGKETEQTAAPSEEDGETEPEESASSEEEQEDTEDKPKKKGGGFQKRIDKLTKERSELARQVEFERQARADLENRLKGNNTKQEDNAKTEGEPSIENFETYADYVKALARYEAKQEREAEKRQEAEHRIAKEAEEAGKRFASKVEEARSRYNDFDEVFDPDLQISGAMQSVLIDSDIGGDLAYYLSAHPDESAKIAQMHPIQAARAMGVIEAKLSKYPVRDTKKVSTAPEPIKPVKAASASTKDPSDLSPDEFKAWYKKTYGRN